MKTIIGLIMILFGSIYVAACDSATGSSDTEQLLKRYTYTAADTTASFPGIYIQVKDGEVSLLNLPQFDPHNEVDSQRLVDLGIVARIDTTDMNLYMMARYSIGIPTSSTDFRPIRFLESSNANNLEKYDGNIYLWGPPYVDTLVVVHIDSFSVGSTMNALDPDSTYHTCLGMSLAIYPDTTSE